MEKYNAMKFMETKDLGSVTKGFFKFTKKGKNKKMDGEDVEIILKGLEETAEKKGEKIKILIRGLNPQKMTTLKGYSENYSTEDLDDYYDGRVENPEKFKEFFFLEFTIIKNKKK